MEHNNEPIVCADASKIVSNIALMICQDNKAKPGFRDFFHYVAGDLVGVALSISVACNFDKSESDNKRSLIEMLSSIMQLANHDVTIGRQVRDFVAGEFSGALDTLLVRSRSILPAALISIMSWNATPGGPESSHRPLYTILWKENQSSRTQENPSLHNGVESDDASSPAVVLIVEGSEGLQDARNYPYSDVRQVNGIGGMDDTADLQPVGDPLTPTSAYHNPVEPNMNDRHDDAQSTHGVSERQEPDEGDWSGASHSRDNQEAQDTEGSDLQRRPSRGASDIEE
jgi:hypothetical protein